MFAFPIEIDVKDVVKISAVKKAKAVETIVNHLTLEALEILARKSTKKGMSKKVIQFKNML